MFTAHAIRQPLALVLSATLLAAATLPVSAQTYRATQQVDHILGAKATGSYVELGLVRSSSDATVELRTFHSGVVGDVIGTAPVHAGANSDVKVHLDRPTSTGFVALIRDGDQVLATQAIGSAD